MYTSSQCQVISHLHVPTYLTPKKHQIHDNMHFTLQNTT